MLPQPLLKSRQQCHYLRTNDMNQAERAEFIADITAAIKASSNLSDDEVRWVKLAIHKQEQSIKLRAAIIEKTLGGLVWAALAGLAYIVFDFAKNHGFK
jgi:hypothetical protein